MPEREDIKELEILRMVKRVLTDVARDTHVKPGMRHPLSDNTILGIRDCLALISARENEISVANGESQTMRPTFAGQPNGSDKVVVSLDSLTRKSRSDD